MSSNTGAKLSQRVFGAKNRQRLIEEYFSAAEPVSAATAWKHVYRLLLWADRTTGLAHCYESDKAQPGRPWYGRSLAFHDWLSTEFGTSPSDLAGEIDWMFRKGTEQLAAQLSELAPVRQAAGAEQRARFKGKSFPDPGEDAELEEIIRAELSGWLSDPPREVLRRLTERVRSHFGQENKRKNLVGEGFEDVLAAIVDRMPGLLGVEATTRPLLHSLDGFRPPPAAEKPRRVDLALLAEGSRRILVTAKWSIRADREEQFQVDFDAYARLEESGKNFEFVLITNEFDAARLKAACERRTRNADLFSSVVHVNPSGPVAAYGLERRGSSKELEGLIESRRLVGLEQWLSSLAG